MKKNYPKKEEKIPDYLTPLLTIAPATWALIRANEIRAVDRVTFKHPVLDVGCGNGTVAKVIVKPRKDKFDVGIDLSPSEIALAKKSGSYKKALVENVYNLPFKAGSFNTVFSNSVIEHIPDLDKTLSEISRVLKKKGEFVITVPTSYLTEYLFGYRFFNALGMKPLAVQYGKFFNSVFKHKNLYTHKQWEKLLKKYDLKVESYYYYHSVKMVQMHELLAYLALPYFISKIFVGYWVVFPSMRKVLVVPWLRKMLYPYYLDEAKRNEGGSLLVVAKKI